jgi:hypothetical protein
VQPAPTEPDDTDAGQVDVASEELLQCSSHTRVFDYMRKRVDIGLGCRFSPPPCFGICTGVQYWQYICRSQSISNANYVVAFPNGPSATGNTDAYWTKYVKGHDHEWELARGSLFCLGCLNRTLTCLSTGGRLQ